MLKTALRIVFALFFVGAGVNHFVGTDFYLRMMPPYVPLPSRDGADQRRRRDRPRPAAADSARRRRLAAWGLIALLVAVFPANLQMALHPETFPEFSSARSGCVCRCRAC